MTRYSRDLDWRGLWRNYWRDPSGKTSGGTDGAGFALPRYSRTAHQCPTSHHGAAEEPLQFLKEAAIASRMALMT